jgi:hypothetical protein
VASASPSYCTGSHPAHINFLDHSHLNHTAFPPRSARLHQPNLYSSMLQALQASPSLLGPQLGLACLGTSSMLRRAMQSWATVDPAKWDGSHPAVANNLGECVGGVSRVRQVLLGALLKCIKCIHSKSSNSYRAASTAVVRAEAAASAGPDVPSNMNESREQV